MRNLHRLFVSLNRRFVQDARRLVRAPVGVDVGAALEEKGRDLEVPIQNRPRERDVQHLLSRRRSPVQVGARKFRIAGGIVLPSDPRTGWPVASNQRATAAALPIPAACGRSFGSGQMRVSSGMR